MQKNNRRTTVQVNRSGESKDSINRGGGPIIIIKFISRSHNRDPEYCLLSADRNTVQKKKTNFSTVGYARTNVIGSTTSFVIAVFVTAYIEIYVFRGNPFQGHSLEQSYYPGFPLYFAGLWLKLYSRTITKTFHC